MNRVHDVLVVGGGVVGLSTALFLQRYGVQPLVVERHRGTSIHPRRPVGVVATESSANNADPMGLMVRMSMRRMLFQGPKKEKGSPTNLHRLAGFGWQYASPLVEREHEVRSFALDGRPGTRLPHVWLDDAKSRSSLDLVGERYTLFLASDAPRIEAAGADVVRPGRAFERRARLARDGAILARPDGVVAWRGRATDAARAANRLVPS